MAQVSLYLDDDQFAALRAQAGAAGVSMSKYAARLIEQDAEGGAWPKGFWDLYGSIDDEAFEAIPNPVPGDSAGTRTRR